MIVDTDDTPCPRCDGTAADYLGGRDVQCCYCSQLITLKRPPVLPKVEPRPEVFRFAAGRFAGLTLEEAASEPNGRRYLEHMAGSDARVRDFLGLTVGNVSG